MINLFVENEVTHHDTPAVGEDFELALSELDSLIDLRLDLCDDSEESIM